MAENIKRESAQAGMSWGRAEELPLAFVDNVYVQQVQDRLYLTLGQVNLPVIVGAPPDGMQLEVRPVFRCAITAADFLRIANAMHQIAATIEATAKTE